jgi:threonine dehydrogenase-like Zn-dependent dehydrogenase
MRAVRHTETGIEVQEVPEGDREGMAVVHVVSSGICGSDLHMLDWGALPFTLGHEVGGRLDDGTPVTVWPLVPCGTCDRCLAGEPQQCRTGNSRIYGVGPEGGMADRILVDPRNIVPLPSGLTERDACLVEPIACSVHALRRAGVTADDRVAVVGAGSIGLGAVSVARFLGCRVDVSARHERQRAAAASLGAGEPFESIDGDGGYDVVVDAAGTTGSIARSFELLRPGGTVVIVSSQWEPVEFPMFFASKEAVLVTATMHGPGASAEGGTTDMQESARLLAAMPEVATAMITHRFPLDQAPKAFAAAADRSAGAIKVVLEP